MYNNMCLFIQEGNYKIKPLPSHTGRVKMLLIPMKVFISGERYQNVIFFMQIHLLACNATWT